LRTGDVLAEQVRTKKQKAVNTLFARDDMLITFKLHHDGIGCA
jgi:hypothetical protein